MADNWYNYLRCNIPLTKISSTEGIFNKTQLYWIYYTFLYIPTIFNNEINNNNGNPGNNNNNNKVRWIQFIGVQFTRKMLFLPILMP